MHFHLWLIWPCPRTKIPALWVVKLTILENLARVINVTMNLVCPNHAPDREGMKMFNEIMHFHYMTYDLNSHDLAQESCPSVHDFFHFCRHFLDHHYCILFLSMPRIRDKYFKKYINIKKKMLTDDAWRTTHYGWRTMTMTEANP